MKKISSLVLLFLTSFCFASDEVTPASARIDLAEKSTGFVGGMLAGLAFHELGHEAMAGIEGANMHWNGLNWRTKASHQALRNIAISGFGAQVLSTEVLLDVKSIPKNNSFVIGWLTCNILNTLQYVAQDRLCGGGVGDFRCLRKNGMNVGYIEAGLVAHSLFSAYRLNKNSSFVSYVSLTRNEFILGFKGTF